MSPARRRGRVAARAIALLALAALSACSLPRWPVDAPITSPFGLRMRGWWPELHHGVDLAVAEGTPVLAMNGGRVAFAGRMRGYGLTVVLRHGSDTETLYAHLSELHVRTGDAVRPRQLLGRSGRSGNARGAHLHFEIRRPVNSGDPTRSWAWTTASTIDPAPSLRAAAGESPPSGDTRAAPTGQWTPFASVSELVERQYLDFYGRRPDAGGARYWGDRLTSGADTPASFIARLLAAPEFEARIAPVARLYWAYFDRIPDTEGLLHWIAETSDGVALGEISQVFAGSPEFDAAYGSLSDEEFVRLVYRNVLDREPDAEGEAFWTGRLHDKTATRGQVMVGFSESPEYSAALASKVRVVLAYVAMLERSPDQGGLEHWSARDVSTLVSGVYASAEYRARIGSLSA